MPLFGPVHLATLAVIAAAALAVPLLVRWLVPAAARPVAVVLAVLLVVQELAQLYAQVEARGGFTPELLPLHLCTLTVYLSAWMLVTRSARAFEVVYFWGLGGTTQALLTPDLAEPFPHWAFFAFFAGHGLIMVGLAYAMVVFRLRPYPASLVRVAVITALLAVFVFAVNLHYGTNFLYLMQKPAGASLLDWFGPWPWYLIPLVGAAILSFLIWYAPFFVLDLLRRRRAARGTSAELMP